MKEHPIIFSADSIRAILDGRKTQSRRVIKPQPPAAHRLWGQNTLNGYVAFTDHPFQGEKGDIRRTQCRFGGVGDRLWVRETWRSYDLDGTVEGAKQTLRYRADREEAMITWFSPIHMPRWASRLTLELTGVRVERLQGITEKDARAEGIEPLDPDKPDAFSGAVRWFAVRWDAMHGKTFPWKSNPWVWVLSFKTVGE